MRYLGRDRWLRVVSAFGGADRAHSHHDVLAKAFSGYGWRLPEARQYVRLYVCIGVAILDFALIAAAANIVDGDRPSLPPGNLLLLLLPAYTFASLSFSAFKLDILKSRVKSTACAWLAITVSAGLVIATLLGVGLLHRVPMEAVLTFFLVSGVCLTLGRLATPSILSALRYALDPAVVLIGDSSVEKYRHLVRSAIDVNHRGWRPDEDQPALLSELSQVVRNSDRLLMLFERAEERAAWADVIRLTGTSAELLEFQDATRLRTVRGQWHGFATAVVSRSPLSLSDRALKRALDLAVVLLLAPVALPLIGLLCLLVVADSPGSPLFFQERVGRNNCRYKCIKLRTMRIDVQDRDGRRSASRDDDRVTRIGRFLRRTSFDELPQLWNVLSGEMTLVGPRPHPLGALAEGALFWEAVPGYWARHSVKPGLTGLAQVRGLRGATIARRDIELRVASDLEYIDTWSIWLDLMILLKTVKVLAHPNAF
jgi:lipopolysaccharide/colanic/teichoic acid biosynthesis glycosyltransferase